MFGSRGVITGVARLGGCYLSALKDDPPSRTMDDARGGDATAAYLEMSMLSHSVRAMRSAVSKDFRLGKHTPGVLGHPFGGSLSRLAADCIKSHDADH